MNCLQGGLVLRGTSRDGDRLDVFSRWSSRIQPKKAAAQNDLEVAPDMEQRAC